MSRLCNEVAESATFLTTITLRWFFQSYNIFITAYLDFLLEVDSLENELLSRKGVTPESCGIIKDDDDDGKPKPKLLQRCL